MEEVEVPATVAKWTVDGVECGEIPDIVPHLEFDVGTRHLSVTFAVNAEPVELYCYDDI